MRTLGDNPAELLSRVNAELMSILKPMDSPLYATTFYLVADAALGQIRFSKAGHPNPLLLQRQTGEVKTLKCDSGKSGPALGMMVKAKYYNCEHPLAADDLILLFTDGIYEVFDTAEKEFGPEKLAAALKLRRELPLDALMDGLLTEARNYSAEKNFDDDICLIALEAVPV
jgi:sigma-B regulation protein RsbU (phosphoserine phosphatase)